LVQEKRHRALVTFTILSGARDESIASMLIRHVNIEQRTVFHDAREVCAKNRKTFTSTFFPVGDDIETIVADWILFLTQERLFGPDDPRFPATRVEVGTVYSRGLASNVSAGAMQARSDGFSVRSSSGPDLQYFNPHSFRNTLAALGEKLCSAREEFKAWSQNLADENVLTTFISYGLVCGVWSPTLSRLCAREFQAFAATSSIVRNFCAISCCV
jgi:hypothetical protein